MNLCQWFVGIFRIRDNLRLTIILINYILGGKSHIEIPMIDDDLFTILKIQDPIMGLIWCQHYFLFFLITLSFDETSSRQQTITNLCKSNNFLFFTKEIHFYNSIC